MKKSWHETEQPFGNNLELILNLVYFVSLDQPNDVEISSMCVCVCAFLYIHLYQRLRCNTSGAN